MSVTHVHEVKSIIMTQSRDKKMQREVLGPVPRPWPVLGRLVGAGFWWGKHWMGSEPPLAKVRIMALNSRLVKKKDRLQKPTAVDLNGDLD